MRAMSVWFFILSGLLASRCLLISSMNDMLPCIISLFSTMCSLLPSASVFFRWDT